MIVEFLGDIGIYEKGGRLDDPRLLAAFSAWLDEQTVGPDDVFYLAARIGAFICEYLIDGHSGVRAVEGRRILIRLPIRAVAEAVPAGVRAEAWREFDPYAVAVGMAQNRSSLKSFLDLLCA